MSASTACAAALAVQKVIREDRLLDNVQARGHQLNELLVDRFGNHRHVGDIRGRGLFYGLEIRCSRDAVVMQALARDMWVYPAGSGPVEEAIIVAPPFVVTEAEIEEIISRLRDSLDAAFTG